ncbi:MAG: sensor histidine kinase [Solirubrobacteraceae bacterium]
MRLTRPRTLLHATADPLLALVLLGLGVYEIWIESGQVAGPRAGNTAFLVLVTVPLAWRRRYPLAVLALVTPGAIAWVSAWYFERQPPFVPFVALLLCGFAVAAATTGRGATAGAGLLAAFVVTDLAAVVLGGRPEETGAAWILLALTWALGRVVHRQRSLAAALAERAAQLEREREEKARLAVALERARIARELHDVVTHNVSVMVVQAGVERRLLGEKQTSTREVLRAVEQTGRETLVELRRLLGVLRKGDERLTLAPQPSLGRLDELIEHIGDAGLPVELRIEGERRQLPAGVELSAFRIVHEALTNALRHAGAARAEVVVRYGSDALEIEVADDGRGPANGADGGHGLVGMRERAALHGGVLEAGARSGGGYAVRARLPVTGS